MSTERCNNHTCKKAIDTEEGTWHTCSLCKSPAYCSEACRVIDWPLHACANIYTTPSLEQGIAVPYFYEDMLTEAELEGIPASDPIFQSYVVRHCNTNRVVTEYEIPPLVGLPAIAKKGTITESRGIGPNSALTNLGDTFKLEVSFDHQFIGKSDNVTGKIPYDMIFKGTGPNEKAKKLAAGIKRTFTKASESWVFWPNPAEVVNKQWILPSLKGSIVVTLSVGDTVLSFVSGSYTLTAPPKGFLGRAARKIKQMFTKQNNIKFGDIQGISPKNIQVFRMADHKGNGLILSFSVPEGTTDAQLVDIEYIQPIRNTKLDINVPSSDKGSKNARAETPPPIPPRDTVESEFSCDARDFEQVVGLAMALDYVMSCCDAPTASRLEGPSGVIRTYARTMMERDGEAPDDISNEVGVSINSALDILYRNPLLPKINPSDADLEGLGESLDAEMKELEGASGLKRTASDLLRTNAKARIGHYLGVLALAKETGEEIQDVKARLEAHLF